MHTKIFVSKRSAPGDLLIFSIRLFPKFINFFESSWEKFLPKASTIREKPLEMVVYRKHALGEHLSRSVDGYDDQNPLPVILWACS